MLQFSRNQKEVVKFAIESYMIAGGKPEVLVTECVELLYDIYENTFDPLCLQSIALLIEVSNDMRLHIEIHEQLQNGVIGLGQENVEFIQYNNKVEAEELKLSISVIRSILGYWPKNKKNIMNGDEVAKDIYEKICANEKGIYFYSKDGEHFTIELSIDDTVNLLNIEKKKIYRFSVKG